MSGWVQDTLYVIKFSALIQQSGHATATESAYFASQQDEMNDSPGHSTLSAFYTATPLILILNINFYHY